MDIFILGIERSATTWLSNILEAHPRTDVYAEPMAMYTSYFEKWPDRFQKIKDEKRMANYFQNEFNDLKRDKRFFLSKVYDSPITWKIDFKISNFFVERFRSKRARNFNILNFHRNKQDFYFEKEAINIDVIKELRLNLNSSLISQINPKAKIVVVIRDYASNIKSIVKYVKEGRLIELRKLMNLEGNEKDYSVLMDYWINSYNTLLKDLEGSNLNYILVPLKNILVNGIGEVEQIFNFLNLDLNEQVITYFNFSNKPGEGIHNTNRDHKYLLQQNKEQKNEVDKFIDTRKVDKIHKRIRAVLF